MLAWPSGRLGEGGFQQVLTRQTLIICAIPCAETSFLKKEPLLQMGSFLRENRSKLFLPLLTVGALPVPHV